MTTDLTDFELIDACGLTDIRVTSLARELVHNPMKNRDLTPVDRALIVESAPAFALHRWHALCRALRWQCLRH